MYVFIYACVCVYVQVWERECVSVCCVNPALHLLCKKLLKYYCYVKLIGGSG